MKSEEIYLINIDESTGSIDSEEAMQRGVNVRLCFWSSTGVVGSATREEVSVSAVFVAEPLAPVAAFWLSIVEC